MLLLLPLLREEEAAAARWRLLPKRLQALRLPPTPAGGRS